MASDWNRASGEGLCTVREVISFWFDERACFEDGAAHLLWDASWMNGKARTQWYAGTSADASCAKFAATIEATARGDLNAHEDWLKWPHGPMAKIILWDQIARNCFRGTAKAFEFDDEALELARTMARRPLHSWRRCVGALPAGAPPRGSLACSLERRLPTCQAPAPAAAAGAPPTSRRAAAARSPTAAPRARRR